MKDKMSVRQWQEQFRAGAYDGRELDTQRKAGWQDWSCHFGALAGRLKRIAPVVMGIREPFVLDNYTVWFVNQRCSREWKAAYDSVRFEPLGGARNGKLFMVDYRSPREPENWTLYTERSGLSAPEYGCAHVQDMVRYISSMARDLERGVRPSFLDEKEAVVQYILGRDVLYPSRAMRREGAHSYSFLDRDDGRRKTVHVARSRNDVPPGFPAREINGLYVYCPEDAGMPLPSQQHTEKKIHRKGTER